MPRRTRLRTRVLAMTAAFAVVLFAITYGLSWRARASQERWSRLIGVETEAIATLEELIRAQNAFHAHFDAAHRDYRIVAQLLGNSALQSIDTGVLRGRVKAFASVAAEPQPRDADLDATSIAVVSEAQRIIGERKREIARTLPELDRDTEAMMFSGLAVAWIVVVLSFAAAQTTLRKVVRPIEQLSLAADRIASGDLTARASIAGDHEVARLAVALNGMADKLRAHARTDDLTALPNFRAFRERIDSEIDRASRYPEAFGILVLDLDRFKKYNDTFGHLAGNDALQRVALVIRETVRSVDFPARYGGEEFAVILPEVDIEALTTIAQRIRANIEGLPAPQNGSTITVSIGGALYPADGDNAEALFHAADERLYAAKHAGRNRVVVPSTAASVAL
jgi:diguanylate cyclase (GGDEF)-like protein